MALRPDRDLFQGRAQPFTFTVTRRERPAEPSSPAENPVTDAASPQSSPVRRAQATAQRHVTRAITLDPSIYASHSRYSQRQFDEEAAAQGEDAELSEDDDAGHELDLEMDMVRGLPREHRANHRSGGKKHRLQGPFRRQGSFESTRRHRTTQSDSRIGHHGGIRKKCTRRAPVRHRAELPMRAALPEHLEQEPMVPGCTPAWMVWSLLDTLPGFNFGNVHEKRHGDRRCESDNVISFLGIILADPAVMRHPGSLPDARTFLIKVLCLAPSQWQWTADGTRQPPWILPDVAALSLSPTDNSNDHQHKQDNMADDGMETDDSAAVTTPTPCGPDDSAFWTWLARQVARIYAPLYAERVQNTPSWLQDGAMAFRILGGDTEGEDDNTYSGKAGNSVSAIGRNLQEMVELLIKARRHTTENETNKEAVIHASDHRVGAGRISDDDMELETIPVDPWASFADACKLFLSGDVGNNTANNACLGLAVDIFCMWREQGRLAQPTSSAHPIWTMTMQKTYRGLGRWVQERQGALSKQDSGLE